MMRTIALRLKPGADPRRELREICERRAIDAACVLSCVGSLRTAVVRFADAPEAESLDGPYEIVGMEGTVSRHGCHFHVALSDAQGQVVGGHLKDGSQVHTTAEIVLGVLDGVAFERELDPETGYDELVVRDV
jgi:predicted DNA-binding protein with PD1-like motif